MLKTTLQNYFPQHLISRFVGWLANCKWVWWKNLFIKNFIKTYHVDMSEALQPNPTAYANFNDFFTRALTPSARPIVQDEHQIACPVDGYVSQALPIKAGKIFQAKGFNCNLLQLLGGANDLANTFSDGEFTTLYLAPHNYHRIHMPLTGKLTSMIYVPGKLFSVSPKTAAHIPELFARNERVITIFDTPAGTMAVILVGAMIVAGIATVWAGDIAPNHNRSIQHWNYSQSNIELARGAELGRFMLGSTVIVLFQKNRVTWAPTLVPESTVKMGQWLGDFN